ncbi:uncharacterized protein BX663DRAFT_484639 [Cokeromyces recurvatus]|uniref:uncharacterized protein n=1 Tax=Cokeromyces recurvatus TaxID=90255 RepID=UPI00221F4A9C|nr:uncharacterized protein BX663DRAFT_484639 [Cokeromyces recurvatus]KAI7904502.1 hypothetical protein BX663DRAFT_484639 [Cokeromyces recurvatus]
MCNAIKHNYVIALVPCTKCIINLKSNNSNEVLSTNENKHQKTINKLSNKRGYKSHVPSACINCKIAHLACDVSRPCKRCVSLKKTDTCQDIQHKKRGRPTKRQEAINKKSNDSILINGPSASYEILHDAIRTSTVSNNNNNKQCSTSVISFANESIESFKQSTTTQQLNLNTTSSFLLPTNTIESLSNTTFQQSQSSLVFNNLTTTNNYHDTIIPYLTIILSMEVCCAKVPDDTIQYWGYYPQELAHRSLYDFISPKDNDRLAQLHRLVIENVVNDNQLALLPTEGSTSDLFRHFDLSTLCIKAKGARSFADTIHIKKRSGEFELYKVVVYIGGGLGADLYDPSTFSKLYIVSQFKKHNYEVIDEEPCFYMQSQQQQQQQQPTTIDLLLDNSFLINQDTPHHTANHLFDEFLFTSKQQEEDSVHSSLLPKIHIAPTTKSTKQNRLLFQHFFPSNQYKRKLSITSSLSSPINVTHPTQQYFLQTSSSALNAAASAAVQQSRFRQQSQQSNSSMLTQIARENTKRMEEMSIRSLLC